MSVWLNRLFYLGPYRLSRDASKYAFAGKADAIEDYDFETNAKKYIPGATSADLSFSGRVNGPRDLALIQDFIAGTRWPVVCQFENTMNVGDFAAFIEAALFDIVPLGTGTWNTRSEFELSPHSQSDLMLPQVLYTTIGTAGSSGVDLGDGVELGALGAGFVFKAIVINPDFPETTGTTPVLEGRIVSDVDDTFASVTSRVTIDDLTETPSAVIYTIDGDTDPITDTFYRFEITAVTGTTPVLWPMVWAGIQRKMYA